METSTYYAADGTVARVDQWDATTYRRFDGTGQQVETRPATDAERAAVTAASAQTNMDAIRSAATTALDTNRTYLALASPTNAQVAAEVKALAQQVNGIIRLVLGKLDGTN